MPSTTSTHRKSEESPEEKNAEACPVVEAIEAIGSKWRLVVLHQLAEGEHRFNELKRETGASSRTLSRVLDDLQEAGLVERRVEDDPLATYYSLSATGEALCPVFEDIENWATEWLAPAMADGETAEGEDAPTPGA